MRTTKAQISLRIRAVWSAPLLFAAWIVQYHYLLFCQNDKTLASLISWAGRFESRRVTNPKYRFSHELAQLKHALTYLIASFYPECTNKGYMYKQWVCWTVTEPCHEKACLRDIWSGKTRTSLRSYRSKRVSWNCKCRNWRYYTI